MKLVEKIDAAIEYAGTTTLQVAGEFYGIEPSELCSIRFRKKLRNGKLSQDELKKIADILDCEYASEFIMNRGLTFCDGNDKYLKRTNNINPMNLKSRIKSMCIITGVGQKRLAEKIGLSDSNLSQRLGREKFKIEELEMMADALNAKYYCKFIFDDGKEI